MTRLLTIPEVAERVRLAKQTVRHAVTAGELRAYKFGREYRVRAEDADAWIESHLVAVDGTRQPVPLKRGNSQQTAFGEVARQMESAGRLAPVENIRHEKAG